MATNAKQAGAGAERRRRAAEFELAAIRRRKAGRFMADPVPWFREAAVYDAAAERLREATALDGLD